MGSRVVEIAGEGIAISPNGRIAVGAFAQAALPQFASLDSSGAVLSVFTPR